jgi:hypothetical protein
LEYRAVEIKQKLNIPFLYSISIFLFGPSYAKQISQPLCVEIDAVCNKMAKQKYRLVSQITRTKRAFILIFAREGGVY